VKSAISGPVKVFCVLAVSQAACLAFGLWLEARFTDAIMPNETTALIAGASAAAHTPAVAMKAVAFFWIAALQSIVAFLLLSRFRAETSRKESVVASESLRQQNDLIRTRDAVIFGLAKLAESRDPETGNHLERIAFYSTRLAQALHRHPRDRAQVTSAFVKLIGISSALHDIGKVGIKDSILLKPGKLTVDERKLMQSHTQIGGRCVRDIELRLGSSNFLQMARDIVLAHHERWDGTGYPRGYPANPFRWPHESWRSRTSMTPW
jgi:HD-GYP domain-containing protein (c-di-GMP phosphodiesterase class II)